MRGRTGKPNQRKADSQAGSRSWGVFANSGCFFLEKKQGEFTKTPQIRELHRFLWILVVIPRKTLRIPENTPNSQTGLRIGLPLVWFARATPDKQINACKEKKQENPPKCKDGSSRVLSCPFRDFPDFFGIFLSWLHSSQKRLHT